MIPELKTFVAVAVRLNVLPATVQLHPTFRLHPTEPAGYVAS